MHAQLSRKHDGDKIWGHREVYCVAVKLQAQNITNHGQEKATKIPSALDWLLPGTIKSYDEVGNLSNSGQVNPYMYTTTLAKLAEEKGAKIVYGSAKQLKYKENNQGVQSVTYTDNEKMAYHELTATDVVVAAGPWTPNVFPSIRLGAPRGHSVVIRPSRKLSPYVMFPEIQPPVDGTLPSILSPEIYPRPGDGLHAFDTVYACGPDDYAVPLPEDTSHVQVDQQKTEDVWMAIERYAESFYHVSFVSPFNDEVSLSDACQSFFIRFRSKLISLVLESLNCILRPRTADFLLTRPTKSWLTLQAESRARFVMGKL